MVFESVCISSLSWRRPSLERLLRTLAQSNRAPKHVILVLDGPQTLPYPVIPAGLVVELHSNETCLGAGHRWRVLDAFSKTVPDAHITFVIDDDVVVLNDQYFDKLRRALNKTQSSAVYGHPNMRQGRTLVPTLWSGLACIRTKLLQGISAHVLADQFFTAPFGHDELLVAGHLWEQANKELCIYQVSIKGYVDFDKKYSVDPRAQSQNNRALVIKSLNIWLDRGLPVAGELEKMSSTVPFKRSVRMKHLKR